MWRALLTEGFAELACDDVVGQRRDVMLGDVARDVLPSRRLRKRRRWLAVFSQLSSRGRISPSGFLTSVFIHSIRSSMISSTVLPRLACLHFLIAEGLGHRLAAHAFEAVDLAAGILDGEGLRIIDA